MAESIPLILGSQYCIPTDFNTSGQNYKRLIYISHFNIKFVRISVLWLSITIVIWGKKAQNGSELCPWAVFSHFCYILYIIFDINHLPVFESRMNSNGDWKSKEQFHAKSFKYTFSIKWSSNYGSIEACAYYWRRKKRWKSTWLQTFSH